MKLLLACTLFIAFSVSAAEPSRALILSCLSGTAAEKSVKVEPIPSHQFATDDDYRKAYKGTFLLTFRGKDLGYADRKKGRDDDAALIYLNQLYPLKKAVSLLQPTIPATRFTPELADWLEVQEGQEKYLCVSTNLDGIGRSGSYQNVRAAYMLPFNPSTHDHLLFAVADTRIYKTEKPAK